MPYMHFMVKNGYNFQPDIDLNAGGYQLMDGYYPDVSGDARDTDKINVTVKGSSEADLKSKIRAIEHIFIYATNHPDGPDGAYVYYAPNAASITPNRSRITDGAVLVDKSLHTSWRENIAMIQVVFERMPWWETADPVTLTIKSETSGVQGTAVPVQNAMDDLGGNYIYLFDPTEIGTLPTPAIILYKNTTNNARKVHNLYVGHYIGNDVSELPNIGGMLLMDAYGTLDATCSYGAYQTLSWTGTGENQLKVWQIENNFHPSRGRFHYFKLMARFRDAVAYTDLYLKAKFLLGTGLGAVVVAETPWNKMAASKQLQAIGTMQFTPFRNFNNIQINELSVGLYGKRAGGDGSINLDYINLMPLDHWRNYSPIQGLIYNDTLEDNPVIDILHSYTSSVSSKITHIIGSGEAIMLQPNQPNALYFLHEIDDGTAPVDRTGLVTIKCHPRRRTV